MPADSTPRHQTVPVTHTSASSSAFPAPHLAQVSSALLPALLRHRQLPLRRADGRRTAAGHTVSFAQWVQLWGDWGAASPAAAAALTSGHPPAPNHSSSAISHLPGSVIRSVAGTRGSSLFGLLWCCSFRNIRHFEIKTKNQR